MGQRKGMSINPQQKDGAFWNSEGDAKRRIDAQHKASNALSNGPFSSDWRVDSFDYDEWVEERQSTSDWQQRQRRKYQNKLFKEKASLQVANSPTRPSKPSKKLARPSPRSTN